MDATEPTEPIDRIDPAEPMHRIEPVEPIDKIDPLDPMLSSEPAEPAARSAVSVFLIVGFSHHWPARRQRRLDKSISIINTIDCRWYRLTI